MNRTKIEWVKNPDGSPGYTWNPITGCLNHDNGLCKGGGFPCYAYKLASGRLKSLYLGNNYARYPAEKHNDPFYPRFWEDRLAELDKLPSPDTEPKGKGIFVCDMGDLFGIGVPEQWTRQVLAVINNGYNNHHRFYLLTKQPQNLIKFSPFPDNCWVGVTATDSDMAFMAVGYLRLIEAKVKFISFEPLLKPVIRWVGDAEYLFKYVDWVIIGACTGTEKEMTELCKRYPALTPMPWGAKWTAQPRIEWVREIVEAADKAGVKVFLKDNLYPLLHSEPNFARDKLRVGTSGQLRQEMPE